MDNYYNTQSINEKPTDSNTSRPSLPARFEVTGWRKVDTRLWYYEVVDLLVNKQARLWLEEIVYQSEIHQARAITLTKLSNSNLWTVYDHFMWTEGGKNYYAIIAEAPGIQYVSFRMLLVSSPSILVVGQIIRQVSLALIYCHSHGVLHGNLNPSYIWIGRDGTVRLELFGALPNRQHVLKNGTASSARGSLQNAAYSNPEQFGANATFTVQTDIYALGVITYEMLAGFNPFLASSSLVSGLRHLHKVVPPLHEINKEVGPNLEAAVMKAIIKNPDSRYSTVLDFLSRFEVGLANTLQNPPAPVIFQTITQLLENYADLAQEMQSFSTQQTSHLIAEPVPAERPALQPAERPAERPKETVQQAAIETVPVAVSKPAVKLVPPPAPKPVVITAKAAVKRPVVASKPPAAMVRTVPKTEITGQLNVIPWLLVVNLFVMGFLAWLLLNTNGSGSSAAPTSFPVYQTVPDMVFITPEISEPPGSIPENTLPAGLETTQSTDFEPTQPVSSLPTVPVDYTQLTPTATTNWTPYDVSTTVDPRVLTALAPTVTQEAAIQREPYITIELIKEDTPTPTGTPTNPGRIMNEDS